MNPSCLLYYLEVLAYITLATAVGVCSGGLKIKLLFKYIFPLCYKPGFV